MSGRLIGIGTGPGDPELVTLKAIRLARSADIVVHLAAKGRASRARTTMAPHLEPGVAERAVELDMGFDRSSVEQSYDALAHDLRPELAAGRTVVVLCEGDPLLFGTFLYVWERLPEAAVEIVPGIASPHAAAAAGRWAIVRGDQAFAVLPATMGMAALRSRLALVDAAAIVKVGRHVAAVRHLLAEWGLLDDALLAVQVSTAAEEVVPLASFTADVAPYFALVLTRGLGGQHG